MLGNVFTKTKLELLNHPQRTPFPNVEIFLQIKETIVDIKDDAIITHKSKKNRDKYFKKHWKRRWQRKYW